MPPPAPLLRLQRLRQELRGDLPITARQLCERLGISQPVLSRLLSSMGDDVLRMGAGRSSAYSLRRALDGVGRVIPLFEIGREAESPRHLADLFPAGRMSFWLQGRADDVPSEWFEDVPWFLYNLRPSGFLGRQIPGRHPDLGLPSDIKLWSGDHVLRYLVQRGGDDPGGFILGDAAFGRYLEAAQSDAGAVVSEERAHAWPERVRQVMEQGPAGSSAGGEQQKFLAIRADPGGPTPVLVKFSPPRSTGPAAVRWADLLVAEHHALQTLADHGRMAARTTLIEASDRVFLEVDRFDRQGRHHRVGLVALRAVDAKWVGSDANARWSGITRSLLRQGLIREEDHLAARWLERFGALIGNTDMHHENLSFHLRGTRIDGLTPAYDMLPMRHAPVSGEVVARPPLDPPIPSAGDGDIEAAIQSAANDFWERVVADARISEDFRRIAAGEAAAVARLGRLLPWLPSRALP